MEAPKLQFPWPESSICFSPLIVSFWSCLICSVSLSLAFYHHPRLFIGFLRMVGICPSLMMNLLLERWLLIMEIFRDLLGLIFMPVQLILLWSFSNNHLVHGFVVFMVVMWSIYALIGSKGRPCSNLSPPTTHADARMITSIAIVNAKAEVVQPAIIPISFPGKSKLIGDNMGFSLDFPRYQFPAAAMMLGCQMSPRKTACPGSFVIHAGT